MCRGSKLTEISKIEMSWACHEEGREAFTQISTMQMTGEFC